MSAGGGIPERPRKDSIVCKRYFEQIDEIKGKLTLLEEKVFDLFPSSPNKPETGAKLVERPSDFIQVGQSLDSIIFRITILAETIEREL